MTNEEKLTLGLAKAKVESLMDYYSKGNQQLQYLDKEGLLGKIAFDLIELRSILDGCLINPFDKQTRLMDEADKRKEALQNERELNSDILTKEVSANNQELLDMEKKKENKGMEAGAAFKVIKTVVNKRRPFEPSDFVKEYFIPDI